ncbi:MAG: 50S ribosomal protein L13 [Chloroflexi bacterium]|nr:50S ribosomal protein L13 [Chloroflexota bacterium]MCH8065366.1 50S ribosomal protein L13 [Chloroflexota bacterium]
MSNLHNPKTYSLKAGDVVVRWHVVDAEERPLGRLASEVAVLLRGKYRPTYTPHMDNGDFVVVVNASKVKVTGAKMQQKLYRRHSGYPGGLKETPLPVMLERHPDRVVQLAVKGMLPHNRLGRKILRHLKVYGGPDHPHEAQVNAGAAKKKKAPSAKGDAALPEANAADENTALPEANAADKDSVGADQDAQAEEASS